MSRIKRTIVLSCVFLCTISLALSGRQSTEISAHGLTDQQYETGTGALQILASEPAGQEFTPTATTLIAADVRIESMNLSGPADVTLRIHSGSIIGPVLAEAVRSLPQGFDDWAHFELPTVVDVTPAQTYVLELDTTNDTHGWMLGTPGGYAGGRGIFQGAPDDTADRLFRTYSQPPTTSQGDVDCSGIIDAVDALKILRHNAGLSVAQTEPCLNIGQVQ